MESDRRKEHLVTPPKEKLSRGSHILFVSDYAPDIDSGRLFNGVQRCIDNLQNQLSDAYRITVMHPFMEKSDHEVFRHVPLKQYPGFEITLASPKKVAREIAEAKPNALFNLTTEGPLGLTTKFACSRLNKRRSPEDQIRSTVAYTTQSDQYASLYLRELTKGVVHPSPNVFRRFISKLYNGTHKVLVHTEGAKEKLHQAGVDNTVLWPAGVDTKMFHPPKEEEENPFMHYEWYSADPKPIYLNYGRLAIEKNLDAFLQIPTPQAHKVIIGDGPERARLERQYPDAKFLGTLQGDSLASRVRFSDLMIFPSVTDTWGQVITEANASGVPVVAFAVPGSGEVVLPGITGITVPTNKSLGEGIVAAEQIDRSLCAEFTRGKYSWATPANILLENLKSITWE